MRLASLFLYEILPWIRDDRGEPEKVTVVSIKALGAKTSTHFSEKCRIFFHYMAQRSYRSYQEKQ